MCRNYCSQVWQKALNQARVKASSVLRKPKSVYYPLVIRIFVPTSSSTVIVPNMVEEGKDRPVEVLTSSDKPFKVAGQPVATKEDKNVN